MYSSRIRTDCSLLYGGVLSRGLSVQGDLWISVQRGPLSRESLFRRALCPGGSLSGGSLSMGVYVQEGLCPEGGGSLSEGISVRETPLPCGQTDTCENITLPQTSFAGGKNTVLPLYNLKLNSGWILSIVKYEWEFTDMTTLMELVDISCP